MYARVLVTARYREGFTCRVGRPCARDAPTSARVRHMIIPDKFAVMAIDPGGTTGIAAALLNAGKAQTTHQLLRRAVQKKVLAVGEITAKGRNAETRQAEKLYDEWMKFKFIANVEKGIPLPYIYLVVEDFQLRQRSVDLSPVKITWGLLSLIPEEEMLMQQPSEAKSYATNERLRKWGVWAVGKEHGRDAVRHLALRASKVLSP